MVENVLAMNLHISARVPMGSRGIVARSELPSVSLFMFSSVVANQYNYGVMSRLEKVVRTCGTCYDDP